jgi:hypothetical protein
LPVLSYKLTVGGNSVGPVYVAARAAAILAVKGPEGVSF